MDIHQAKCMGTRPRVSAGRVGATARNRRQPLLFVVVLVLVLAVTIAACGTDEEQGSSDEDGAGGDAESPDPESAAALDEVYEEIEGLEPAERTAKLISLANEEGELSIYTSNGDIHDFMDNFEEAYPDLEIELSAFRAGSDTVLQRLVQEASAGFRGADVTELHAPQMGPLSAEGLLAPLNTPVLDGRPDYMFYDDWAVTRMTAHLVGWNVEALGDTDPPQTYEELADSEWAESLVLDSRAFDWFLGLYGYLETAKGWSEEELKEYFEGLAANSISVEPQNAVAEILATGERAVTPAMFSHILFRDQTRGAPVEWEPIVEPTIVRPSGVGVLREAAHPAAALLFTEWLLTDASETYLEFGFLPVLQFEEGGQFAGVEVHTMETDRLWGDEAVRWGDRYRTLLETGELVPLE